MSAWSMALILGVGSLPASQEPDRSRGAEIPAAALEKATQVPHARVPGSSASGAATSRIQAPSTAVSSLPSVFPEGYLDHAALTSALRRVAREVPGRVRLEALIRTNQGREVWLVTLSNRSQTASHQPSTLGEKTSSPFHPPAILIVANLEADHVIGTQVAVRLIEHIARDTAWEELLTRCTIHIIPRLNPDGAERLLHPPHLDVRTNLRPLDRDRDGRSGEDGPDDLNGDGIVVGMRVKDGKATLHSDADDPRILRKSDPAKGEHPVYSEYVEGIDNDGDGLLNEDPPGGVNLNRNWPHRWAEFDPEAGSSPASEPETHALIQFALSHPEIAVIWSFGLNDNLTSAPKKPEATFDDADLPIFMELSRIYGKALTDASKSQGQEKRETAPATITTNEPAKPRTGSIAQKTAKPTGPVKPEPTKPTGANNASASPSQVETAPPIPGATTDGSLSEWAYHHYGVIGLSSRLWQGPELPVPKPAGEDGSAGGKKTSTLHPAIPTDGEARWLYWNDHVMGGRAFVAFTPFDHPTLGHVELGGWKPGVRLNPPIEQVGSITQVQQAFLGELVHRLPRLSITDVKVSPRGKGVFQVTARVMNEGAFPTALERGSRNRKADPVHLRLDPGSTRLLAGPARAQIDSLGGAGGNREFRWLLLVPSEKQTAVKSPTITLHAATPKAGEAIKAIPLDQRK